MIENTTIEGRTTVSLGYGNVVISTNKYISGVYIDFKQLVTPGPIGSTTSAGHNETLPHPHPSVTIMIDNLEAMKALIETLRSATEKLIEQRRDAA